jgi:hypothetical protein
MVADVTKLRDVDTTELIEQRERKPIDMATAVEIDAEIQRRQSGENIKQIGTLVSEVRILKEIVDKNSVTSDRNSRSSNRLARAAISIAIISIAAQVVFSIHQETDCLFATMSPDPNFMQFQHCYRTFDFGIFGSHSFRAPDILRPLTSESNWPVLFKTQPKS